MHPFDNPYRLNGNMQANGTGQRYSDMYQHPTMRRQPAVLLNGTPQFASNPSPAVARNVRHCNCVKWLFTCGHIQENPCGFQRHPQDDQGRFVVPQGLIVSAYCTGMPGICRVSNNACLDCQMTQLRNHQLLYDAVASMVNGNTSNGGSTAHSRNSSNTDSNANHGINGTYTPSRYSSSANGNNSQGGTVNHTRNNSYGNRGSNSNGSGSHFSSPSRGGPGVSGNQNAGGASQVSGFNTAVFEWNLARMAGNVALATPAPMPGTTYATYFPPSAISPTSDDSDETLADAMAGMSTNPTHAAHPIISPASRPPISPGSRILISQLGLANEDDIYFLDDMIDSGRVARMKERVMRECLRRVQEAFANENEAIFLDNVVDIAKVGRMKERVMRDCLRLVEDAFDDFYDEEY